MFDIATTYTSLKHAVDVAQGLKGVKDLMDNADVKLQIADLLSALADTKADLAEIKTQMIDKDRLIAELQDKLNVEETVYYEEPFYWKDLGNDKREGPFCQRCNDDSADTKLVRLISKENRTSGTHVCNVCKQWYGQGVPYHRSSRVGMSL